MSKTNRHLKRQRVIVRLVLLLTLGLVLASGCIFSPKEDPPRPDPPPAIPEPITPEAVIEALQVIYNDQVRNALERRDLYENLFSPADHASVPGYIFRFQPIDVEPGEEPTWGLDSELSAHENMFRAQENRDIFSLELTIQHTPPELLEFPPIGQEDWVRIFATNVFLRLMFNPQDGLLVDGGQAEFLLAPADGRWYLVDWKDLPRP